MISTGGLTVGQVDTRVSDYPPPRPILKWAGGKTKLLSQLLLYCPRTNRRYFEPFLGGGALFFALRSSQRVYGDAVLGDGNADLMDCYRAVRDRPDDVLARLAYHAGAHAHGPEEHYYQVRSEWNRGYRDAAMFIYLNRVCFNGLWRVNRFGEFNVPMGRYVNPRICDPDRLRAASLALQRTWLRSGDYRVTVEDAKPGDFVYFDPPYVPVSATSDFAAYTADGFGAEQHRQLEQCAHKLRLRGVYVMLSNSDSPFVRALYSDWRIHSVSAPRAINSCATKRGGVGEVIIVGGGG